MHISWFACWPGGLLIFIRVIRPTGRASVTAGVVFTAPLYDQPALQQGKGKGRSEGGGTGAQMHTFTSRKWCRLGAVAARWWQQRALRRACPLCESRLPYQPASTQLANNLLQAMGYGHWREALAAAVGGYNEQYAEDKYSRRPGYSGRSKYFYFLRGHLSPLQTPKSKNPRPVAKSKPDQIFKIVVWNAAAVSFATRVLVKASNPRTELPPAVAAHWNWLFWDSRRIIGDKWSEGQFYSENWPRLRLPHFPG